MARLAVVRAPISAPPTVILKRWRIEGEESHSADSSTSAFFNDWASMEFLQKVTGDKPCAPQVYAGDKDEGFVVMEDMGNQYPLDQALRNGNSAEATQALIQYGKLLGILHGKTAGHLNLYPEVQKRLNNEYHFRPGNYTGFFESIVTNLSRLEIDLSPDALSDIQKTARLLSNPGEFITFTHGDPVFGNILEKQGHWYLIDFEAARLRHAMLEGMYLRMLFPTSGLLSVQRIPEQVWRRAESAYRTTLGEFMPAARDVSRYGPVVTAACAFWILDFLGGWLGRAMGDKLPPDRLSHVRRCIIARCELFVATTQEFQSMRGLGEFIASLMSQFRSKWPQDDCDLPLYRAFMQADSG